MWLLSLLKCLFIIIANGTSDLVDSDPKDDANVFFLSLASKRIFSFFVN